MHCRGCAATLCDRSPRRRQPDICASRRADPLSFTAESPNTGTNSRVPTRPGADDGSVNARPETVPQSILRRPSFEACSIILRGIAAAPAPRSGARAASPSRGGRAPPGRNRRTARSHTCGHHRDRNGERGCGAAAPAGARPMAARGPRPLTPVFAYAGTAARAPRSGRTSAVRSPIMRRAPAPSRSCPLGTAPILLAHSGDRIGGCA